MAPVAGALNPQGWVFVLVGEWRVTRGRACAPRVANDDTTASAPNMFHTQTHREGGGGSTRHEIGVLADDVVHQRHQLRLGQHVLRKQIEALEEVGVRLLAAGALGQQRQAVRLD